VFQSCAETAKENCPVSKALSGVEIVLKSSKLTEVPVERA
jgi:organic hydroperoxide reductase OsmC/OhrA